MSWNLSQEDISGLLMTLPKRMAEAAMGAASMPPEGIMERALQNSLTREDLLLFQEILREELEERATLSTDDPSTVQAVEMLNLRTNSLLERIEEVLKEDK